MYCKGFFRDLENYKKGILNMFLCRIAASVSDAFSDDYFLIVY